MKRRFSGPLGQTIKRHLALRRSLGFICKNAEYVLDEFNQYLATYFPNAKTVTRPMVVAYLKTTRHLLSTTRADRVSNLRQFCRFLFQFNLRTYIPEKGLVPPPKVKVIPHIYTEEEVSQIMSLARSFRPRPVLVPHTYTTLIGLLWVSGIRIGEAVRLNLEDVDIDAGVLHVRQTKFFKSRLVPLSPSTTEVLSNYKIIRAHSGHGENPNDPFFVNKRRRRLDSCATSKMIRGLSSRLGLKNVQGRVPRVHDLRHSFATRWLAEFYRSGMDPIAHLPILATYMGHVNIACTQVYLHPSLELLRRAGEQFAVHIKTLKRSMS